MLQEAIRSLAENVTISDPSLMKEMEVNFRSLAGSRLEECADYGGLMKNMGINLTGENVDLSLEFFFNAFILSSAKKDSEVVLSSEKAKILAMKKNLSVQLLPTDTMVEWVLSEVGVSSETEKADLEEEEYEDGWGHEEETGELEEVEDPEEDVKEEVEEETTEFDKVKDSIKSYYYQFYKGVVSELAKRHTALFSSGYEVTQPAGILSSRGLIGLSGNQLKVKQFNISIRNMYNLFLEKMNFIEVEARSNVKIADTIYNAYVGGERRVLYFPNKLIEYAYGRKSPSGDNQDSINTYEEHSSHANWSEYCRTEVEKSLMAVVGSSVVKFIYLSAKDSDYYADSLAEELQNFLGYLQKCLSLCMLMINFKSKRVGIEEDIFSFKIRICDPSNFLGDIDVTPQIIDNAFMGSTGSVPFSYSPRFEPEVFVKEYAHEFNHNSSQAAPLFAYKAYLALKEQGQEPYWDSMILGKFEDDSILRNGKNGLSLNSKLTHQCSAGSRAGKGVMTMNFVASGIFSNKNLFYIDRKPDMASMFKSLSPNMFVVNGGGYGEQYDTYHQFNNLNNEVNWGNVPTYVADLLDTSMSWDALGDLFYMRALKLVMGIIVARGDGRLDDPNFGGKDGVILIVDEFKNFQESYSGIIEKVLGNIPPSTYMSDKGKMENDNLKDYDRARMERDFGISYNNKTYYALSYLNSLVADLEFLSTKRDAGFNQEEIRLSDIFVIGQHLNYGSLDYRIFRSLIEDSSSSGRYKSSGRTGVSSGSSGLLSKLNLQESSFPYSMVSFKTSDAFFGRNMEEGRDVYLAQTNKASKSFGRLDDKASNFAYMSTFTEEKRRDIVNGNPSRNVQLANSCTYFKPFLVLNDAQQGDLYTEGMFRRCAGTEPGKVWVSREEIIAENPNEDGSFIHPAVGFEGYLKLMGVTDYSERLAKSGDIANFVVQNCLGYPGTWFEFITDLRPQWLFTIKDIVNGAKGLTPDVANPSINPVVSEFVRFNPSEFGLEGSEDYTEDSNGGMSVEDFMDDYSNEDYMQAKVDVDMASVFGDDEEERLNSDKDFEEDEEINLFATGINETLIDEPEELEEVLAKGSKAEMIKDLLLQLKNLGVDIPITPTEAAYEAMSETAKGGYTDVEGNFKEFGKTDESVFDEKIEFTGDVDSYAKLVDMVSTDLIKKFGGLESIVSLKVIGGSIVVNGYYYRCKAGDIFARNIPYDVRREINSGNISRLFNYSYLRNMPRVRDLEFDSTTFVYDYVSTAMGYGSQISVDRFFDDLPALQCISIGKKMFTRQGYLEELKGDDVFYHPRMSTRCADVSEDYLGRASKSSWDFTKNTLKSKEYGGIIKTLGVTGGLFATGVTGAGKVAVKGGRKAFKGIKKLSRSVKEVFDASKDY